MSSKVISLTTKLTEIVPTNFYTSFCQEHFQPAHIPLT